MTKEEKQLINKLKTKNQKRAMMVLAVYYTQVYLDLYREGMRKDLDDHGYKTLEVPEPTFPVVKDIE